MLLTLAIKLKGSQPGARRRFLKAWCPMPQIAIAPSPAIAHPLFVAGTDIVPAMSEFGQMQGGLLSGVFLCDPGQCEACGGCARINL